MLVVVVFPVLPYEFVATGVVPYMFPLVPYVVVGVVPAVRSLPELVSFVLV